MIIHWDVYEIRCESAELHGVKLRGRIRKFTIEQEITCFVENASDEQNVARFALISGSTVASIESLVKTFVPGAEVVEVFHDIPNPVLSKLKVNDLSRYEI